MGQNSTDNNHSKIMSSTLLQTALLLGSFSSVAFAGQCLTTGGAKVGVPCVFPFKARGVTYTTCTKAGGFDIPWCSTMVDANGDTVLGNWGDCPMNDPTCPNDASTAAPETSPAAAETSAAASETSP